MNVTIVGASGFVGRHLSAALKARGDAVTATGLRDPASAARACEGADAIVNLAGEPVAQAWTASTKAKIISSRVEAPAALIAELRRLPKPPGAYVSASAIGYYGVSESETFDESSGPGTGFLAEVCVQWETIADSASAAGMRVAKVRTGLALGTDGGALAKLLPIFRLGLGGIVAGGRQWYSWIHIDDLVGIYIHAVDGASGVLDATAPAPVRNADFTHALARALHRPAFLPVPSLALSALMGEAASVITQGQRVLPARTLSSGYVFRYPELDAALKALFP